MEMVDLYDENRLPLGRTAERYAPKGEGEYRVVVHICVFDSRGRLLIQQRSREKAVWPEAWDVSAAGGVDAGETSRQAAEREFREELGVALDLTGVRPSCTVNFDGGFDDFFLVERDLDLSAAVLQREEVAQVRWAELPEILGMSDRILVIHQGEINGELDAKTATQEQILYLAAGYKKLEGKPAPTLSHEA